MNLLQLAKKLVKLIKNEFKMISLLQVEYGYGSETCGYTEIMVKRENKKIIKIYNCFSGFLITLFRMYNDIVYYGYGYEEEKLLYRDLKNKEISIEIIDKRDIQEAKDIKKLYDEVGTIKLIFLHTEKTLKVINYKDIFYACDNPINLIKYLKNEFLNYNGALKILDENDFKNINFYPSYTNCYNIYTGKKLTNVEKFYS